ncbi:MAG TPA: carboxypeptidase-like regulatory domain-containing protein [Blastocatellia bacterium]|nr:carboxypeptidase-like regulatory domain-containing protein [Blastocatellia bacterium]
MRLLRVLAVIICGCLAADGAFAQATGTLKGRLESDRGKAIPNAAVRVMNTKDRSVKETKTDSSGDYSLDLPAGEYTLGFDAAGFEQGTLQTMQQVEEGKVTRVKAVRLPKAVKSSLIRGSVFDATGRSISGAHVSLVRVPTDEEAKDGKRVKSFSREYISNIHGEFAFRLPPVRARYKVTAGGSGYRPDTKVVEVHEDESVPLALTLLPLKQE